ncbi:MAG: DUF1801 domain-containing protein [Gemmatimonadaceae bacterium]|nr:DUF1801 domain-containing protein [Gemmatimonadaceae bacterium]
MTPSTPPGTPSASDLITKRIADLGDWRGETLRRMRTLIHDADPGVVEEWKWMGTPVFSHHGILCTGETYKSVVKLTFHKGASLADPARLFNASLEGNARRAIDIREGEVVDAVAFTALVRAAIALNAGGKTTTVKKVAMKKAAVKKAAVKQAAVKQAAVKKAAVKRGSAARRPPAAS